MTQVNIEQAHCKHRGIKKDITYILFAPRGGEYNPEIPIHFVIEISSTFLIIFTFIINSESNE